MVQRWSVYDPSTGKYSVYQSNVAFRHHALGPARSVSLSSTPLGDAPEDLLPELPPDSIKIAESEVPQGRIAAARSTLWSVQMASVVVLGLAAWIWWKKNYA